jgi:hypothetical protein
MKAEELPAARDRIEAVGEVRLDAGALVEEGQRTDRRLELGRYPVGVLLGLGLEAGERHALLLGLDRADQLLAQVERVVLASKPGREGELAHRDAQGGGQVHLLVVQHDPAARLQRCVYRLSCLLLRVLHLPLPFREKSEW